MLFWLVLLILVTSIGMQIDQNKSDKPYSSRFSFCITLNRKMKYYYNWKQVWTKTYLNVVLPISAFLSIYSVYSQVIKTKEVTLSFLFSILSAVIYVLNAWLFRGIDSIAYIVNVFTNIFFLVSTILIVWHAIPNFALLTGVMFGPAVLCNLVYFHKRRDLFFYSAHQLKELYGDES